MKDANLDIGAMLSTDVSFVIAMILVLSAIYAIQRLANVRVSADTLAITVIIAK